MSRWISCVWKFRGFICFSRKDTWPEDIDKTEITSGSIAATELLYSIAVKRARKFRH